MKDWSTPIFDGKNLVDDFIYEHILGHDSIVTCGQNGIHRALAFVRTKVGLARIAVTWGSNWVWVEILPPSLENVPLWWEEIGSMQAEELLPYYRGICFSVNDDEDSSIVATLEWQTEYGFRYHYDWKDDED